jgi:predicted nucleic acid-binding protein
MIVSDASAVVEALIGHRPDEDLLRGLAGTLFAPHLLDIEVLSALRGLTLGQRLASPSADDARTDYFALTINRCEALPLADRIWSLRHRHTSYDACYLALAEALELPLYTCDAKLDADSHDARVKVFGRTH